MMLPFSEAHALVLATLGELDVVARLVREPVPLAAALGRVLAAPALVDRDLPPFDRVLRDGFAVRAADVAAASASAPVTLPVVGEVRAGQAFTGTLAPGQALAIYTGAPLPAGADAVVMVEDTRRDGDRVAILRATDGPGHYVVARGAEAAAQSLALPAGTRLGPSQLALLATLGVATPTCSARPRVAIVSTGDEIVPIEATPAAAQIRNSNATSLAAQVLRAGGQVSHLAHAADQPGALRAAVERALADADLLLLSGGVSMGKYDLVEDVLADLGARTLFDAVALRPGKPTVFGVVDGKPFFGLPGNPLSTMVTFELFARPALELLAGLAADALAPRFSRVTLARPLPGKPMPLLQLVPARRLPGGLAEPVASQGSGDLAAMARADGWLVIPAHSPALAADAPLDFLAAE